MLNLLKEFVHLSKYAGGRFDLIQAGGGNTSVKLNHATMLIKASGFDLSEVEEARGHVEVDLDQLIAILTDRTVSQCTNKGKRDLMVSERLKTVRDSPERPSIETFMHALLGRFVLHSHPITVNIVACQPDWRNTLNSLFPGSALIGYNTPGIDTALALMASLERQKLSVDEKPFVVFLQNHGMIVSAETCDEVIEITNQVVRLLEAHLNVDFADYRTVSSIAETVNKISNHPQICYLSQDKKIYELIMNKPNLLFSEPICPDMVVYNGSCPLEIENLQDPQPILEHMARKNELPRIILYEGKVFFMAPNVKKAQAMESVLKFHLLVMNNVNGEVMCLENSEIAYILNWEAEKYRKEL